MKAKHLLATVATALCGTAVAGVVKLDMGATGQPVGPGWIESSTNVGFHALAQPVFDLGGGVQFAFTSNVDNYGFGVAANPVVQDGFFVVGTVDFTLSGLTPGQLVTMYAIHAWDGNGRAAFVQFGGGGWADTSTSPDVFWNTAVSGETAWLADPTPASMVLVAQNVAADATGKITGQMSNAYGTTSRPEGQLGGVILDIQPIPEPAAIGTLIGAAGLLIRRRRSAK